MFLNLNSRQILDDLHDFFFQFEADRRAFIITINSFGTELTKDDRAKLYPTCGKLNPDGLSALARADDNDQVSNLGENWIKFRDYAHLNQDQVRLSQILVKIFFIIFSGE